MTQPTKPAGDRKPAVRVYTLRIRLTSAELARLKAAAGDITLSRFVRRLLFDRRM